MRHLPLLLTALGVLCTPQFTLAQTLTGDALIRALQRGGYVLVVRHASAPRDPPAKAVADPDNVTMERQLDEHP